MASFELIQVKRENHPFHSNILPFIPLYFPFGAGNSAPAVQANSLLVAGGGQRLLRLLTNVLEACKRTSIPVKLGRIQTRHSRKGEIAARQLVSFAAVSHTAQRQPLTRFDRESTTGLKI